METYIKELFDSEECTGRLNYEGDKEYRECLARVRALYPGQDIPDEIFALMDASERVCFAHGLKLGLRLGLWAAEET